jgi:hypothetical protein
MSVASAEEKQQVIRKVLQGLAAAQAPVIRVRLFALISPGPRGIRGLLNPDPLPAAQSPSTVDESALPPGFREDGMQNVASLRIGNELHVVVSAPTRGYLHLFNLGSSGDVRRMLPRPGEPPSAVDPGRAHLSSPAPAIPWIEKGPANGFPERVLAVVTAEPKAVPPSCLHPSWNDLAYTRGFGPPVIEPRLSAWPAATWSWGFCEALLEA